MSELTIKYIDGRHAEYNAENIKESDHGVVFDTFDETSTRMNHFFVPYSSILFTNNVTEV